MRKGPMSDRRRLVFLCLLFISRPHCAVSPYSLHSDLDYSLVGTAAALRGYAEWVDHVRYRDTTDFRSLERNDVNPFDRWAIGFYSKSLDRASTVLTAAEFGVPILINAWDIKSGKEARYGILTDFILYAEVYLFSSSLAIYAKGLEIHPRPLAFTSNAPESERRSGDARSSFFSAHTTSAFASAVFTGYTFQLKHPGTPLVPWVWGGMLGAASTVGALRIYSGKHFPSDVLMGAAVGTLFGYGIPRLHLNKVSKEINKENSGESGRGVWRMDFALAVTPNLESPMPLLCLHF
jgi:membrane-associated phospholipid phosphatase